MKIGIDLSPAEKDPAGIGQYSLSLFGELCKLDKANTYIVYTSAPFLFANAQNKVIKVNKKLPSYGTRWMKSVSVDAKKQKLDLFLSPSNQLFTTLFPRTIQFIHDLAPLRYPKFFGRKASLKYRLTVRLATSKALKILTISQTVKDELCDNYPIVKEKIDFVYPGINKWIELEHKNANSILEKYNIDYEYLLTISTLEPRKNLINTIRAFKLFMEKIQRPYKLVIVGKKGWFFDEIFKTVQELKIGNDVKFLGYVPNQDLSVLIKNAKAFVFLSFYEGFGIPPIEALRLNIKTLVSDIPVFHEAYKDQVLYTDQLVPDRIADSMKDVLEKEDEETHLFVQNNYSWEKSAQKLLTIINEYK